jgi:Imelysin
MASQPLTTRSLRPRPGSPRGRRRLALVAGLLAAVALVGSALDPAGLLGGAKPFSVHRNVARPDPLGTRISKVYGTSTPARIYGTEVGDLEDLGENLRGQMISDLTPLPRSAFARPVAAYRRYSATWLRRVEADAGKLTGALAAGDRAAAKAAWMTTWAAYLRLGAVYLEGPVATLNQAIDGTPGGLPRGTSDPRFSGLHRIEMGLWEGQAPRSLVRYGRLLRRSVAQLLRILPKVSIDPLDYATRSHEILEDAQRDLLSGMDVPWSGEGVLGTVAGLDATDEVVRTLRPLLQGRDNTLIEVDNELLLLHRAFDRVLREHDGRWPTLSQLTTGQRELIDGTMAGALGALEQLPGTLETTGIHEIPSIPSGR